MNKMIKDNYTLKKIPEGSDKVSREAVLSGKLGMDSQEVLLVSVLHGVNVLCAPFTMGLTIVLSSRLMQTPNI